MITKVLLILATSVAALSTTNKLECDVLILGGSLSAVSAAITASRSFPNLHVCLTEPTDWPGGQFTSSGVSAPDFGLLNRNAANLPETFNDLI
jgi:ribulose 1,5-bisphosphate synthetase/thiazole synthase